MRKKWLGVALMVFAFAAVLFFILTRPPPEPTYEGKTVSYWIKQIYLPPANGRIYGNIPFNPNADAKAKEAVQKIGTNGLPYYIHCIDARDSRFKLRLVAALDSWNARHGWISFDFNDLMAATKHRNGLVAIRYLEPNVLSAAPALVRLLRDCNDMEKGHVVQQLGEMGPQSVNALTNALSLSDYDFQREIILALGGYGHLRVYNNYYFIDYRNPSNDEVAANAMVVVPLLINYVNDTNKLFRDCALISLSSFCYDAFAESNAIPVFFKYSRSPDANMRKYARTALIFYFTGGSTNARNVLVGMLHDTNAEIRGEALISLGDCGLSAENIAPEIKKALNDPDLQVRTAATNALGRVKGSNLRFE